MEATLNEVLTDYRTESAIRRLIANLLSSKHFVTTTNSHFRITGSLFDNTASTLDIPDMDLLAMCSLKAEKGFKLKPNKKAPGYYRIKLVGSEGRELIEKICKVFYARWDMKPFKDYEKKIHGFCDGDYVSSDSFRIFTEFVGKSINASRSDTGAASSASVAAKPAPGSLAMSMREANKAHVKHMGHIARESYFYKTFIPKVFIPLVEDERHELHEREMDFDIVTTIDCDFDSVPLTSDDDWRLRDQTMWDDKVLKTVDDQGLWLSAKIGHEDFRRNRVDDKFDFSVSFPVWVLFKAVKGARHVLVCIKDVYRSFDEDRRRKKKSAVKSYFFKTVMVWLKEERYKDEEPNFARLFIDTLEEMVKCFEKKHLRHFLLPEVNLLQDIEEREQDEAIFRLKKILKDPLKYLRRCKKEPMDFSGTASKFTQILFKSDCEFLHKFLMTGVVGNVINKHLDTCDYSNHNASNETALEKVVTDRMCSTFWNYVWHSSDKKAEEKLGEAVVIAFAVDGVNQVVDGFMRGDGENPPLNRAISAGIDFVGGLFNAFKM